MHKECGLYNVLYVENYVDMRTIHNFLAPIKQLFSVVNSKLCPICRGLTGNVFRFATEEQFNVLVAIFWNTWLHVQNENCDLCSPFSSFCQLRQATFSSCWCCISHYLGVIFLCLKNLFHNFNFQTLSHLFKTKRREKKGSIVAKVCTRPISPPCEWGKRNQKWNATHMHTWNHM